MRWVSVVERSEDLDGVVLRAVAGARAELEGLAPHLAVVTLAGHTFTDALAAELAAALPGVCVVGGASDGVIGGGEEVERRPALALTLAHLPDVNVRSFVLPPELVHHARGLDDVGVARAVGAAPEDVGCLVVWASPSTCNAEELSRSLDRLYASVPKAGGLVRGDAGAGVLLAGGAVHAGGAVGVALRGDVAMDVLVAQGCKPIGPVMEVTEAAGHVLIALDEAPALEVVQAVMDSLPTADRQLLQRHPMLGVAMDPAAATWRRGDFLIRQIIGVDPRRGALAVGHALSAGDRVQLHARDASTSSDDLAELLARHRRAQPDAAGAMLFSCLGRGEGLYGRRGHDSALITAAYPGLTPSGLFCAGELGPVHGRTFLHGFTAVVALFRAQEWS